jgi:MFS family permease
MFCYFLAACACLNSCNLGYDIGSVGGAAMLMKEHFGWTSWEEGFYVGSINFFCIAGAFNAAYICDRFGRIKTFTISCCVFIIGLLIQVVATGCVRLALIQFRLRAHHCR